MTSTTFVECAVWCGCGSGAEDLLGVRGGEAAAGVHRVAGPEEVVEPGVKLTELRGVARVHLAPVRTAADSGRDRFERAEIFLVRQSRVLMDRHVGGVPAVGSGQPDVVGGGGAALDGEH